ncbi:MAG TPA: hypothetical protein VFD43_12535 [Planctomycetota bacterium]|nr:hypothetical protein [Planctomycetota bacterium]
MAWTIGTTAEQADLTARRPVHPALRLAVLVALAALLLLAILGQSWALPAALLLLGARLLLGAAADYRAARPPAGGPCFAIATLREGPVEVVGRVLPPERGLLSPLTSTKCSYYDYAVELLDEASGEHRVVDQGTKLTDFWLKDVTGSIKVETPGIVIGVRPQLDEDLRRYDQTPRAVGERLQKLGIDPFVSPGVRRAILFRETRLDPGDNMLVRGTAVRGPDGALVIRKAGPADALSVERWTQATFVPEVPTSARRNLWIGAALALSGAVWLAGLLAGR